MEVERHRNQNNLRKKYTLKYCQLCLVVDARTFAMNTVTLEAYSKLLQLPLHNKEPYICYECSALLLKYQKFHAKCLRSHNVLTSFKMQSSQTITHECIESQRKMYNLESNLSQTAILHEDNCSDNEFNITSNENSGYSKINMLIVKNEAEPYVYGESDYYVKEETYDKNQLVTNDIQETIDLTFISDLDNEPLLPNIKNSSKQLLNTPTNKGTAEPSTHEIEARNRDDHDELTDTFISDFHYKPLDASDKTSEFSDTLLTTLYDPASQPYNKPKKLEQNTSKITLNMKSKKYVNAKEKINESLDTSCNNIEEELLSDTSNSKEIVDKATQIVKSMLHERFISDKQENDTNEDLEDRLLQNIGNSEELVKKATAIVNIIRNKSQNLDLSFYDGFARVVKMTPEDARKQILLRRESSNYLESPYKCEICYRGFTGETTYDNHMKRHSEEHGSFECEFCHARFINQRMLNNHISNYHKFKIFCTICPAYVTCSRNHARDHIRQHKGKKFPCDECDVTFSHRYNLLSHKNQIHAKDFNCDLCGNSFGSRRGLICHKNYQHKHQKQAATSGQESAQCGPRCAECAVQFATEAAYARHRALSHQQAASQGCEFCGETFSDYQTLKAHVFEQHTQKQPRFCCLHCPFRFWELSAYKSHVASQHHRRRGRRLRKEAEGAGAEGGARAAGKPTHTYVCEYCGKDVKVIKRLYHRLKHTGERPYKCKLCGKGFAHPSLRNLHVDTHATTRQYQCDKCPKNYKLKGNLAKHIRTTHNRIRPHVCHICGKNFPFPYELKLHVKYTHEKVPWPTRIRKRKAETT